MPFKEKQVVWIEFQNHADPQAKVHPAGRKPPLSIFKPLVLLQFDTAFRGYLKLREPQFLPALLQYFAFFDRLPVFSVAHTAHTSALTAPRLL